MARKKIPKAKQEEIDRLKNLGHSKSEVARLLNTTRETGIRYWDESVPLESTNPAWVNELDWEYIRKELDKRIPRKILYKKQSQSIELPSYQAFCEYLRTHEEIKSPEVTIKIHRILDSSIEVDYSGDKVQILNPATGELYEANLFVGSLSYSGYFYPEFTLSQRTEDFIMAHNNMFSFFGGAASFIIPENYKTAVIKNKRND
jgi:transposase